MDRGPENGTQFIPCYVDRSPLTTISEEEEAFGVEEALGGEQELGEMSAGILGPVLRDDQVGMDEVIGRVASMDGNDPITLPLIQATVAVTVEEPNIVAGELVSCGSEIAPSITRSETPGFEAEGEHEPLAHIAEIPIDDLEEPRVHDTTGHLPSTSITTVPPEILSRIFFFAVKRSPLDLQRPFNVGALDLLHISHVCSLFREVTLNTPTLWALVPFINHAGCRFLALILKRSKRVPITVFLIEDAALSRFRYRNVCNRLLRSFGRITSLRVEVAEGYGGSNLLAMLSLSAPCLKECIVIFHGHRNVCLDFYIPRGRLAFGGNAPQLRTLHLINCYIHPELCDFPSLITTSISYGGIHKAHDPIPLMSIQEAFDWTHRFVSLQHLTIVDSIQSAEPLDFRDLMDLPPARLPHLKSFAITASPEVCHQIRSILYIPSTCSRVVHIVFLRHDEFRIHDAHRVAAVACAFVPSELVYTICSVDIRVRGSTLSLTGAGGAEVVIAFYTHELNVQLSKLARHFFDILCLPVLAALHKFVSSDIFLCRLWQSLASNLQSMLASVRTLCLSFDTRSTPHILPAFSRALTGVATIVTDNLSAWNYLCFASPSGVMIFPNLQNIEVPLDDNVASTDVNGLATFIQWHGGVDLVSFRVKPQWLGRMGVAGSEEIRCIVATITTNFPPSVALDWVEDQEDVIF
ncbi:hypothetical protein DFP72DRAFT_896112 [Ephemerocybe angulata]|uniref:F-box domain-containing protein n=1 Tax=Ephemerocybe angulata TaxID=980116 RepID=A0A8H6M845_9AGAR|nr:hypothetical protein DFP72DRAFT_896112 [Tulosesus angulatus]